MADINESPSNAIAFAVELGVTLHLSASNAIAFATGINVQFFLFPENLIGPQKTI